MSENVPAKPPEDDRPPAASRAEQAAREASDQEIAPHEKQAIGSETSREEDA
mgnify:CR=1 FL=1